MKSRAARLMDAFRYQPIRSRILLSFVFISSITALLVSAGSSLVHYSSGREQAVDRLTSVLSLKQMEVENWVGSLHNELLMALNDSYNSEQIPVTLKVAQSHHYFTWYNKAVQRRLAFFVSQSNQFQSLCLADLNGNLVLCSDESWSGSSCSSTDFFRLGLEQMYVQLPYQSETLNQDCWVQAQAVANHLPIVSRPVLDLRGQIVGVIAGLADPATLAGILDDRTGLGRNGKAYLVYPGYSVVSPVEDGALLLSVHTESTAFFANLPEIQLASDFYSGTYTDYLGSQVLGVAAWLPDAQAFMAVEQDVTEVFRSIALNLLISLGIGLAAAFATVVTAIFITRSITRPVTQLMETASEIAGGRLEKTVPVHGNDEISTLGRVFNTMTAQLRELINNLEQIVQNRTLDLQKANQALKLRALQMESSARVSREITTYLDYEDLLNNVAALIADAFAYSDVRIYLLENNRLTLRACSNPVETVPPFISLEQPGIHTRAVQTRSAISSYEPCDSSAHDETPPNANLSELCVPLQIGNKILGTLDLVQPSPTRFTGEELLLAQSLGDQIAIAIENTLLHKRSLELAVHQERNRLSRDLHDSVVQYLYSLNLMASGWKRHLQAGEPVDVLVQLDRTSEISHQALKEMRLMVYQLLPDDLEWKGLSNALKRRLEIVEKRAGITARLIIPQEISLPSKVEEGLYLIAQEALNNSLKHSDAREVDVHLELVERQVVLQVSDNGHGFEFDETGASSGMGLSNMKARADELRGSLSIQSSPENGTSIRATIPIDPR